MKRLTVVVLALAVLSQAAVAWDFLYREGAERRATRSADPFARLEREGRVESLPVRWERKADGEGFLFFVEWDGAKWYCIDGTMSVPASELPYTISKLDLLLALRELDKMDAFFAWLEASGLKPFWDAAQIMATDHPLYEQALSSVQQALGLTDEERDAILEQIAKPAFKEN